MGLLQALAAEALSGYFPTLGLDNLRLNLRSGRLDLNDVQLNPGQVFATASFPFRLSTGFIKKLGLHVPWNLLYSAPVQLHAHAIEIHIEEIPFPSMQSQVFDAFKAEVRRLKHRALAEAERAESTITRALEKFLPLLLDRVEANFSDITLYIHFADPQRTTLCITLANFSTTSKTIGRVLQTPKPRRDLSKAIVATGISVRLTVDDHHVFCMKPGGFVIHLSMRDGAYDINIDFPQTIHLHLDLALSSFFRNAERRTAVWTTAFQYTRPAAPLARDVRAWFRYAVAAVLGRAGKSRTALTIDKCREVMSSCVEYRRLHVLRLRKKDALKKEEEVKIEELEDRLDADMILFLRATARADVMAEEVSAFATKDWLSWALFGYNMSEEREHLAGEIRKSLLVAEQAGQDYIESIPTADMARNTDVFSRTWTKASIKFVLPQVLMKLARQKEEVGVLLLNTFEVKAEVDSSMQSYSMSSKLGELRISDGDKDLFCQEHKRGFLNSSTDNFMEANSFKPAVGNVVKLDIRVAPSAIVFDIGKMSRYVDVVRLFQTLWRSVSGVEEDSLPQTNNDFPATLQSMTTKPGTSGVELVVTASLPQFRLYISNHTVPQQGEGDSFPAGTLSIRDIRLKLQDALNVPRIRASCSASLSVCSEYVIQNTSLEHSSGSSSLEAADDPLLPFHISGKVVLETMENRTSVTLDRIVGQMTLTALEDASNKFSDGIAGLRCDFLSLANDSPRIRRQHQGSLIRKGPAVPAEVHLNVTSTDFFIQRDESESRGKIVLSTGGLRVLMKSTTTRVTFADEFSISETSFGAKLSLSSISNLDYAAKADIMFSAEGVPTEVEIMGASVSLVANPASLVEVLSSFQRVKMMIMNILSYHSEGSMGLHCIDQSSPRPSAKQIGVSVVLNSVEVVPSYQESVVFLRFWNAHFVDCGDAVSGSLDHPQLVDRSELSGNNDVAIRSIAETMPVPADERSLTFTVTPNAVSIHLFSLEVTVLGALAERVMGLGQAFADAMHVPSDERNETRLRSSPSHRRVVCVQASNLSVCLPSMAHHSDSIAFNTTQLTMTICMGSVAVSIRKLNILTKTRGPVDVLVDPASSTSKGVKEVEWVVLVRGLDLDVSRNSKDDSVQSDSLQQAKSELEIHLLSKAVLFVSPSQVRLLKEMYQNFPSNISLKPEPMTEKAQGVTAQDAPFLPFKDHAILKIETQQVSVELINEDNDGSVVSTIAGLELDHIRFHQNTLREEPEPGIATEATQWNLESFKLKLSDRASEVLPQLREVIRNGEEGLKYFPRSNDDSLQYKPCVLIESVYRRDKDGILKSSADFRLQNLLLVPSPALCERLIVYFRQCSSLPEDERRARESGFESPDSIARGDDNYARSENDHMPGSNSTTTDGFPEKGHNPMRKVSISLVNSFIQVFGRGRRVGESSVLIRAGLIKAVLLHDRNENLLQGSQIRLRDASFSIIWLPSTTVRAEQVFNGLLDQFGSQTATQDFTSARGSLRFPKRQSSKTDIGSSWRHSLAVPREKFQWDMFRQANKTQSSDHVAFIRSAVLRFPVRESAHVILVVSSVSVVTKIRQMLRFAYVLSVANILPNAENEGALISPPIQIAVNNITINAQTPLTFERNSPEIGSGNQAMIRIRGTFNGLVGKNLSAVSGSLKVAADVMDKKSGTRDQIIAPTILDFEAHGYEVLSLSFSARRLIRLVISPLTARVVTSIILNVLPLPNRSHPQKNRVAKSIEVGLFTSGESAVKHLNMSLSLQGIVLCAVADEPRVQLLRLLLRHIESEISIPLTRDGFGSLFFSLQDVVLEDTISWRFSADEVNEDGAHWSNIFAGTEGTPGSGIITRVPLSRLLYESTRILRLGSTEKAESAGQGGLGHSPDNGYVTLSQQDIPLLRCTASWQAPLDHVAALIQLRGMEFNLNMSILPGIMEWVESVKEAAKDVRNAHLKKFSSSLSESAPQPLGSNFLLGIDHFVIEPVKISISVKAPPRRIQETAIRRLLMWLFGSDQVRDLMFYTPHVVFSGDFDTPNRLMQRLRTIYLSSFSSQRVGRQLFFQTPAVVRLARVAVTSLLRRRHSNYSFLSSSTERRHGRRHQAPLGLLDAITDTKVTASTCVRITATASNSGDLARNRLAAQDQGEKVIETLDITSIIESPGGA